MDGQPMSEHGQRQPADVQRTKRLEIVDDEGQVCGVGNKPRVSHEPVCVRWEREAPLRQTLWDRITPPFSSWRRRIPWTRVTYP